MRKSNLVLLAALVAVPAFLSFPLTAQASSETPIPAVVTAWFNDQAVAFVKDDAAAQRLTDPAAPDFSSATSVVGVTEVYAWSTDFTSRISRTSPVVSTHSWVGAIMSPSGALGTVTARLTSDQTGAEFVHWDSYAELGTALPTVTAGKVVYDAPSEGWFVLNGTTVTPLNKLATAETHGRTTLEAAQTVIGARYKASTDVAKGIKIPVGGGGPVGEALPWWQTNSNSIYGLSLLLFLAGGGSIVVLITRSKRAARQAHAIATADLALSAPKISGR